MAELSVVTSFCSVQVVELMSSSIRDMMCAEFSEFRDFEGKDHLPDDATLEDWKDQTFLVSGSLMAKSCRAAMMLGNHDVEVQRQAYNFGMHVALAHQVRQDQNSRLVKDRYVIFRANLIWLLCLFLCPPPPPLLITQPDSRFHSLLIY